MASKIKSLRTSFNAKRRILIDFSESIISSGDSVASSVSRRYFLKYHTELVETYQTILEHQEEFGEGELEVIQGQFIEVNKLVNNIDATGGSASIKPEGQESHQTEVRAKLPIISLPTFSGQLSEWLGFSDLFNSLVHERTNISDSEKHYYLRASITGEALSLIKHLPMDGSNYQIAFKLLRERYDNVRLLADSYISRIVNLPMVTDDTNIRKDVFDPIRESTQALSKLKLPVAEWSYLLLFIILQKLPTRIRALFEERCCKDSNTLPTFGQLMDLLEVQCRMQHNVAEQTQRQAEQQSPRRSPLQSSRPSLPPTRWAARPVPKAQVHTNQVNRSNCSYCSRSDHSLYQCNGFLRLNPTQRKNWAWDNKMCFRCLRDHISTSCTARNWCKHCKSSDHNSLICKQDSAARVREPTSRRASLSPRPADQGQPIRSQNTLQPHTDNRSGGSSPRHSISQLQSVRPRKHTGELYRQAERAFDKLRFGQRRSSDSA